MSSHELSDVNHGEALQHYVPIHVSDRSIFDGAFTFMKERFAEEMRRIEQEMTKFSKNLMNLYAHTSSMMAVKDEMANPATVYEVLISSPLIKDEGDDKLLNLQFDVSQYEPHEINVHIVNDVLVVTATHEEKTADSTLHSAYHKEFRLPAGTDPESVESTLSKEGILTVRTPLHLDLSGDSYSEVSQE